MTPTPALPDHKEQAAKLDRYLVAVSEVAALLLTEPDLDQALPRSLELLRVAARADRCALVEHQSLPGGGFAPRLRYESCAPGLPSVATLLPPPGGEFEGASAEAVRRRLAADQPFSLGSAELSSGGQRFLNAMGIGDLVLLPLQIDGQLWGKLGLDSGPGGEQRTEHEVRLLRSAADVIGLAIARERREQERREREGLHRQIVEGIYDGIWIGDTSLVTTFVNRQMAALVGWPPEELIGRPIFEFFDADGLQVLARAQQDHQRLPADGWFGSQIDLRLRRRDGNLFWAMVAVKPIFDPRGVRSGVMATVIDITARRELERQEREAGARYSSLTHAGGDLVFRWTPDLRITFVNDACARFFGRRAEELLGQRWVDAFPVTDREALAASWLDWIKAPQTFTHERQMKLADGDVRWVEWTDAAIYDAEGKVVEAQSVGRDMTTSRRQEELLRLRNAELAAQTKRTEEADTALRVVLQRAEEDRRDMEAKALDNVRRLIQPTIEQLKQARGGPAIAELLGVLERRLAEIASPFLTHLTAARAGLTPREIEVAQLIRGGKTCKEIATSLMVSELTVKHHRRVLRRKLGLERRKANLRAYLRSLE
jgi:PAS domain S-box-containing protein